MQDFQYVQDVKLFHDKFGLETPTQFVKLPDSLHSFRSGFFQEELNEYEEALNAGDLETQLDSLIDLIYIISGAALLHGIQHEELYSACMVVDEFFSEDAVLSSDLAEDEIVSIQTADKFAASVFIMLMRDHIASYDAIHAHEEMPLAARHEYVKYTLASMFSSTMTAAGYNGCSEALWNELWADVQRANMAKERALRAGDSKRGSTWDVIKPQGWVPPRTAEIIAKHKALEE